jgi:hypothetical protein
MATRKQIEANRRNAQNSTGPQSPETKAKTRLNAMRDGFTGQITTLSDEDRPIFEKFKSDFINDLAPKTVMELSLASSMAWDTWRLNHLRAVEMNLYALGTANNSVEIESDDPQIHAAISGAVTFVDEAKRFALMSMYEQRMNRSIHKNLATLRELQAERKQNYHRDIEEEIILARANDIKGLPYEVPAAPTPNGSVFSNPEIFAAAHRVTVLQAAKTTLYQTHPRVQFAGASSSTSSNVAQWPQPDAA